jgi:hypothetical protein
VLNCKSNGLRLPKSLAKSSVPEDKDKRIEDGKQAEPEQVLFVVPPPKRIENDGCCAESCNYVADE